ncbi:hypothetical protein [Nitratireductor thuwali]|uniref:SMP-30/Gluconolactonase/LRE-like region domain-containing protein n=1 Tax=Nitratireductor thuwali TaxID=2267699 RepID=A0ABY5MS71_9HYPH|nr:hypothetical protein NTH_04221 [Nitratireductor thuwali]
MTTTTSISDRRAVTERRADLVILALLFLLTGLCPSAAASAAKWNAATCDGEADPDFICGPANAEDLVRIPGTHWVLASHMAGPGETRGMFYLLNAADHSWRSLEIDAIQAEPDSAAYPDCPGRPASASFHGQGLALAEREDGLRLLAVGHGGREAVEIFDIVLEADKEPSLVWRGCVPAPDGAQLNSVAALPDGAFAVTKFFDENDTGWTEKLTAGKATGAVLEWSPGNGWEEVEGTAMSGPNGILATPDGSAYFVAEWRARRVHRIERSAVSPRRQSVDIGVFADNLQWDEAGRVLVTGQRAENVEAFAECPMSDARVCHGAFDVLRIDPETLKAETIVRDPGSKEFGSGTTALDLGSEYWIGTFRGNRIARISKTGP